MLVGIDRLHFLPNLAHSLSQERVGLLSHQAAVDKNLTSIAQTLFSYGIKPRILFGPEHGYGAEAQDMVGVKDSKEPTRGTPIISLYGQSLSDLSPKPEHLEDINTLIVDLCDVGSRYYTFAWSALLAVRAAHKQGVRTVLFDRPNPIGGLALEGKPQRQELLSFVGLMPICARHGLTLGEMIAEMASLDNIAVGPNEALDVVAVDGWSRASLATQWDRPFIMPSPNMPTVDTALVYPGGCLLEGTNLSEGRGTTRPFELCGSPWLDEARLARDLVCTRLGGFIARPATFKPVFHKYAGQICRGVQIHVTNPKEFRPMATYVAIIALSARQAPEVFRFRTEPYEFVDDIPAIDLLAGSTILREGVVKGLDPMELVDAVCTVEESERETHKRAIERVAVAESRR